MTLASRWQLVAVEVFQLSLTLETKNHRIVTLPIFRDGGMELREFLQARQLIDHEPCSLLTFLGLVQETQDEQVDP